MMSCLLSLFVLLPCFPFSLCFGLVHMLSLPLLPPSTHELHMYPHMRVLTRAQADRKLLHSRRLDLDAAKARSSKEQLTAEKKQQVRPRVRFASPACPFSRGGGVSA